MHPEMDAVCIRISPEDQQDSKKMSEIQKVMDAMCDATIEYEHKLMQELGIDEYTAQNITYLRGRSRWSQELEDRVIKASKAGHSQKIPCLSGEEEEYLEAHGF